MQRLKRLGRAGNLKLTAERRKTNKTGDETGWQSHHRGSRQSWFPGRADGGTDTGRADKGTDTGRADIGTDTKEEPDELPKPHGIKPYRTGAECQNQSGSHQYGGRSRHEISVVETLRSL